MKAYSQNILITQVSQAWWIRAGIEGEVLIWITALLCQNSGYSPSVFFILTQTQFSIEAAFFLHDAEYSFLIKNEMIMEWNTEKKTKKKQKKKQVLPKQQAITKVNLKKNVLTSVKWAQENYLHFNLMCLQLLFVSELVCHLLK